MKDTRIFIRIGRLMFGLFLYALGIAMTIQGNIGLVAWDVLHQGISMHTGLTMGRASIAMAVLLVGTAFVCGEKIGLGTVLNMFFIGFFLDIILASAVVPAMGSSAPGFAMMVSGLFVIALASFFYMGAGFGAGPRDSLMVLLVRKFGCRVGIARVAVEGTALSIGWLLGGFVGLGTVVAAFGIGMAVQIVFRILRFDVKTIHQESMAETFHSIIKS